MKRILSLISLLVITVCVCYSQNTHMTFEGVSLGLSVDDFIRELIGKGMSVKETDTDARKVVLTGSKVGKRNYYFVNVSYTPVSKKVYMVIAPYNLQKGEKAQKEFEKLYSKSREESGFQEKNSSSFDMIQGNIGYEEYAFQALNNGQGFLVNGVIDNANVNLLYDEELGETFPQKGEAMNFMGIPFGISSLEFSKALIAKGFIRLPDISTKEYTSFYLKKDWGHIGRAVNLEVDRMIEDDKVWSVNAEIICRDSYINIQPTIHDAYSSRYEKAPKDRKSRGDLFFVRNSAKEDIGRISIIDHPKDSTIEISYVDTKLGNVMSAQVNRLARQLAEEKHKADSIALHKLANDGRFHFSVNNDGTFGTVDNRPYYVIQKGKLSAHKIYTNLLANISKIFVNPSSVVSGTPDRVLVINGLAKDIYQGSVESFTYHYDVFYRLEMQIKDGRLRVNPPIITKIGIDIKNSHGGDLDYQFKEPSKVGALMLGDEYFLKSINNIVNYTIYCIVNGVKSSASDDNW